MITETDLNLYAIRAAKGFLYSLEYYENRCPPVGDGKVSLPCYYSNMLGKVLNSRRESLPGDKVMWWGERYRLYAQQILAAQIAA